MQAAHRVEPEHVTLNTTSSLWNFSFFIEIIATNKDYQSKKEEKGSLKQSTQLHCCCSVAQFCPTLCDPMNCSTPGFPALHYLPEFAQSHVH